MGIRFFFLILVFFSISSGKTYSFEATDRATERTGYKSATGIYWVKMIKANNKLKANDYTNALNLYQEIYSDKPDRAFLNYRIGECYFHLNNKKEALRYLEKAKELNSKITPKLYLMLGQTYHTSLEIGKALESYIKYREKANLSAVEKKEIDQYITQCYYALRLMKHPENVEIENLGPTINSKYSDYAPSVTSDESFLIFTSRRENTTGGNKDPNDYEYFEDIYIANRNKNTGTWEKSKSISPLVNTEGHDACLSISPDGKTIFLYKNNESGIRGGDIYESSWLSDSSWTIPQPLSTKINTPFFESSASITQDGNILYFVSERSGGYGKGDIYKSQKQPNGEWGDVENLGSIINTEEDEIAAFISPDGKTLYYSSKGLLSIGGYDIYKSEYKDGKWSAPENLGYPINTPDDDLHFTISGDGQNGYYSSIRKDSYGGRDIYRIRFTPPPVAAEAKKIKVAFSTYSLLNGVITDSSGHPVENADVNVTDTSDNKIAALFNSNKQGKFTASIRMDKAYRIAIEHIGYEPIKEIIKVSSDSSLQEHNKAYVLNQLPDFKPKSETSKEESEVFKYIFFEPSSTHLKLDENSKEKLNTIIKKMKNNPKLTIEISGHTDNTGSPAFNKQLSLKRAQAVAAYMQKKGLSQKRVKVKGYGSETPLKDNETEAGRKVNRRVEVTIQ